MGSIYYGTAKIIRKMQTPGRSLRRAYGDKLQQIGIQTSEDVTDGTTRTMSIIIKIPWKEYQYTMDFPPINTRGSHHFVDRPDDEAGVDSLKSMLLEIGDEIYMVNKTPVCGRPLGELQQVMKDMWIKHDTNCVRRPKLKKSTRLDMIIARLRNETPTYITIHIMLYRKKDILINASMTGTREVVLELPFFKRLISVNQMDQIQIRATSGGQNLQRTVYKMIESPNVIYLATFHSGNRCLVTHRPNSDRVDLKKVQRTTKKKLLNGQHVFIIDEIDHELTMYECYGYPGNFLSYDASRQELRSDWFYRGPNNRPPDHMLFKIE